MTRGRPAKTRPVPLPADDDAETARRRAIGVRARECRERLGWSMKDLASRSGFAPEEVRRLEAGLADAKMSTLVRLARALECSEKWLLLGEGDSRPSTKEQS